jgi:hypothetical protein
MEHRDLIIMVIIGGVFLILGAIGIIFGKKEEGAYYSSISDHVDVREFMEHIPGRPEPGALRTGGKICFAVGLVVLFVCLGIFFLGKPPSI